MTKPANPFAVLVEGLIFAAGRSGLERKFILEKVPIMSKKELEDAITYLKVKYPDDGTSGVVLYDYGKVLCFVTHTSIGEQIADALKRKKQKELSQSLMEVLAIIAYQQPITKGEVEEIREGKNCDYAFGALLDAHLIEVVGRKDTLGRPMLYGTTQMFLEKFELKSLRKLPSRAQIEERIAIIRQEADDGGMLFREGAEMDDTMVEAPVVAEEEEVESLVGAGEEGDYDDTDYEALAAADEDDSAMAEEVDELAEDIEQEIDEEAAESAEDMTDEDALDEAEDMTEEVDDMAEEIEVEIDDELEDALEDFDDAADDGDGEE